MDTGRKSRLDLAALLTDRGVSYQDGGRGWLQLHCPFCYKGDGKMGLGYNTESGAFHCWACGSLRRWEVVAKLLGLSLAEAGTLIRQYEKLPGGLGTPTRKSLTQKTRLKLPYGTGPLGARHLRYLESRGFRREIVDQWGLLGTGILGPFANRIIAPIFDQSGKMVCFQGRDITGKSKSKYKSCPDEEAVVPIKDCVYGLEKIAGNGRVVITEGVTKCWRLGPGAVCTFGAQVSDAQVWKLSVYESRFILFDGDKAGESGREALAEKLRVFPGETQIISIDTPDVGDLSDKDAAGLMKRLLK